MAVIKFDTDGTRLSCPAFFSGLALDASGMDGEVESLVNMAVLRLKGQRVGVRADAFSDVRTAAGVALYFHVGEPVHRAVQLAQDLIAIGVMEIASEPPP